MDEEANSKPGGLQVCSIYLGVLTFGLVWCALLSTSAAGIQTCKELHEPIDLALLQALAMRKDKEYYHNCADCNLKEFWKRNLTMGTWSMAGVLGEHRTLATQAGAQVVAAFACIVTAVIPAAYAVSFTPEICQKDFGIKGTLSNLCQDTSTARGRIFSVMLSVGSVLMMLSGYTLYIYMNRMPRAKMLQLENEHHENLELTLWLTIPHICMLFTALLPSVSDTSGQNVLLYRIHNAVAPLSLLLLGLMETHQLLYAEYAFQYFFCEEAPWIFGPLTFYQRLRVTVLCFGWLAGFSFVGVQGYMMFVRKSWCLALSSFFCEITALFLVYLLPVLQVLQMFDNLTGASPISESLDLERFLVDMQGTTTMHPSIWLPAQRPLTLAQRPLMRRVGQLIPDG